jgi:hypothetical protein
VRKRERERQRDRETETETETETERQRKAEKGREGKTERHFFKRIQHALQTYVKEKFNFLFSLRQKL